jgi:DNA-binding PadR family transcriptional regulator
VKKPLYDSITIYRDTIARRCFLSRFSRTWHENRFGRGDIKYVILDLLRERPSYGYEIIRGLEEKFGGLYTPSAGTVYPTLQMLEDLGYVTSNQSEGRKVFTITPAGRQFLDEQKSQVADVRERMSGWWDRRAHMVEIHEVLNISKELRKLMRDWRRDIDPAKLPQIRAILERTYREIEDLLRE